MNSYTLYGDACISFWQIELEGFLLVQFNTFSHQFTVKLSDLNVLVDIFRVLKKVLMKLFKGMLCLNVLRPNQARRKLRAVLKNSIAMVSLYR